MLKKNIEPPIDLSYAYGGHMSKPWKMNDSLPSFCHGWNHWRGSFYELGLAYASTGLDQHSRLRLLQYVWEDPHVLGVVFHPDAFGEPWKSPSSADISDGKHTYGYIQLSANQIVGCASYFSSGKDVTWFVLYIPLAMLTRVYPVNYEYPITHEGNPWTVQIDEVLAAIGTRVYREFPFNIGVLGEEASAVPMGKYLAELAHDTGLLVPESLFQHMGVRPYGLGTTEGLWWTGGTR